MMKVRVVVACCVTMLMAIASFTFDVIIVTFQMASTKHSLTFQQSSSTADDSSPPPTGNAKTSGAAWTGRVTTNKKEISGVEDIKKMPKMEEAASSELSFSFSSNFTRMVYERGANFLTPYSGCVIASWFVNTYEGANLKEIECNPKVNPTLNIQNTSIRDLDLNLDRVKTNDTIYVPLGTLDHFVYNLLPNITADVVVITGKSHLLKRKQARRKLPDVFSRLYNNIHVLKVLCMSPSIHAPVKHKKLTSFPYGVNGNPFFSKKMRDKTPPLKWFTEEFFKHLELPQKTQDIFVPYVSLTNKKRQSMPRGPKLPPAEYYAEMARSHFVYSPDGDRPECYRHYEAIAFGAIPITELHPAAFPHFKGAPVIYNNSKWENVTESYFLDMLGVKSFPAVNRNMIFEEFWMEYVESVVGRPLYWWDRKGERHATVKEMNSVSHQ